MTQTQWSVKYRPLTLDDVVGQEIPKRLIASMLDQHDVQSMILTGPPGCGKTTCARIIADTCGMPFEFLNATTASLKDLKDIIASHSDKTGHITPSLLYLDEIQYFNKKQQQSLLSFVEDGSIILVAATTENPAFSVYKALVSRCITVQFECVKPEQIKTRLDYVLKNERITNFSDDAVRTVATGAAGDIRQALTTLQAASNIFVNENPITTDMIRSMTPAMTGTFDAADDDHYALISALQKSIRGSDVSAAVFYLMRLLTAGDLISPMRRLPAICCEDIGMADPYAIVVVMSCIDAANSLGLPEAAKPMTQAVMYLASAPKSRSNEGTFMPAAELIKQGLGATVPRHLNAEHATNYVWPQDHPFHWTPQQYMPDDITDYDDDGVNALYRPDDNAFERTRASWWWRVRHNQAPINPTDNTPSNEPRM